MKTLLAVGCSFTDKKFKSRKYPEMDRSWPKWPELLGKKLGYNVVNRGKAGSSNELILRTAQDYLAVNKADMICVLWTEPYRLNIHDCIFNSWLTDLIAESGETQDSKVINGSELAHQLMKGDKHIKLANEQLRYIHSLDVTGTFHNVPVYHMQGCPLWRKFLYEKYFESTTYANKGGWMGAQGKLDIDSGWMAKEKFKVWIEAFLNSPYFAILDKQTNIYGWPFYKELGGSIGLNTSSSSPDAKNYRISDKDSHPNAHGQEVIADRYYELIHK
jgi:hypothetical protein